MDSSLEKYIAAAREKKLPDDQIHATLIASGWTEEQVTLGFAKPNNDLPVPPPPPAVHIGMWVGFLYIIFFISLYVLATSIGWLLHDLVETQKPSPTEIYNYYDSSKSYIRGLVASIIVSFPIFMTLAFILKRQLLKQPSIRNLRSRKILIYITLIGTFLLMLGHVIYTLYDFLGGNFTDSALKHLLITFLIAGSIFWYFISEVKHDSKTT